MGAVGANIPTLNFARCLPALYDIKHIDISARCAFTNTIATAPYRGAGRPEANYVLERVVEEAARVSRLDPATLRRRNLIPASAMPYKTAVGTTYDSGDFGPIFDKALALADYDGFKARRREAKKRGKYRGIGLSCMLEHSGGSPLEGAWLTFPGDGTLTVNLNVQSTGQGHASVFPRLIAERLGIAADKVRHHHGDSALEIAGYASVGSRSAMTAGASIVKCIDLMIEKGKRIAAALLETAESDIAYERGAFGIVGTDRRIPLFEVAARAAALKKGAAIAEDLDTKTTTETPLTFPNGVHVAEVEIDPDTGRMQIVAYTAVDDCGNSARRHDRRGATARRAGAGTWPGADGADFLRRCRPAHHRLVPGLRDAARRRHAADIRDVCTMCARPPIRSASKVSAKPAPRHRSPP